MADNPFGPLGDMFFFRPPQFYQPATDDPTQFPRWEPIADEDSLMYLAATDRLVERLVELQKEAKRLQDQMDVIAVDLQGHKLRLFQRLRDLYSQVTSGYGYGWRKKNGCYYVVGWDEPKPNSE